MFKHQNGSHIFYRFIEMESQLCLIKNPTSEF